jgi:hypothetical protein
MRSVGQRTVINGGVMGNTQRYTIPDYLLLLFAPPLIFFALGLTPIIQLNYLDPYLYAGYTNNFRDLIDRFGVTYYSVRMGYLLPAVMARKLAGPVGGYFLLTYVFALLASVPLYALVRSTYGRAVGVYAFLAMLTSIWLERSLLWTYVNAAVIAYLTCALSLVLLDPAHRRLGYFLVGGLCGLAVHSHSFVAPIAVLLLVPYAIVNHGKLGLVAKGDAAWAIAGAIATTIIVIGAFRWASGSWGFFGPTLKMIEWVGSGAAAGYGKDFASLLYMRYAIFPIAVGLLAGAWFLFGAAAVAPRVVPASVAFALSCAVLYLILHAIGATFVLSLSYYFSYLLPAFLMCSTLLVSDLIARTEPGKRVAIAAAIFAMILPAFLVAAGVEIEAIPSVVPLGLLALVLIAAGCVQRIKSAAIALAFSWSLLAQMCFFDDSHSRELFLRRDADSSRALEIDVFRVAVRVKDLVVQHAIRNGSHIRFWYTNGRGPYEPNVPLNGINSMFLWGYSRLHGLRTDTPGMPVLGPDELTWLRSVKPGAIVLLGYTAGEVERGEHALSDAGFTIDYRLRDKVCSGVFCVFVAIGTNGAG